MPSDFDIRSPVDARISELIGTSLNGTWPVNSIPIITMRATQRKMMSRAVTSASVG